MITLPSNASYSITANVAGLFSDLWPIIQIILGIVLGLWIGGEIVSLIRHRNNSVNKDNLN